MPHGVNEVRLKRGSIVRDGLRTSLTDLRLPKGHPSTRTRWQAICNRPALFIVGRDRAKLGYFWRQAFSTSVGRTLQSGALFPRTAPTRLSLPTLSWPRFLLSISPCIPSRSECITLLGQNSIPHSEAAGSLSTRLRGSGIFCSPP
jgi:hypothetical protein